MVSTLTSTAPFDAVPPWANGLTRWPGIALAFLWGFAEGTLFFILPDVPLSLAAMIRPRRALIHLAAIVAGALLAGAVMFSWSARGPTARSAVAHVPLVTPAMFERAESDYREFGIWAARMGPVRGIPYKVYAVEAPEAFQPAVLFDGHDPRSHLEATRRLAGFRRNGAAPAQTGSRFSGSCSSCALLDCGVRSLLGKGEIAGNPSELEGRPSSGGSSALRKISQPLGNRLKWCKIAISRIDPVPGEQTAQAGENACSQQLWVFDGSSCPSLALRTCNKTLFCLQREGNTQAG